MQGMKVVMFSIQTDFGPVSVSKSDDAAWSKILSRISEGKYEGFIDMLYTTKYDTDSTELGIKARWIGDGKHQEQLISG